MPLIETKGAASAQGFGGVGAGASGPVTYIEDVFSTWLYTGNSSTQTITNGIDLAGKGGLVWTKSRGAVRNHSLRDTVRGRTNGLSSNLTDANLSWVGLNSFNSNGYTLGDDGFSGTNSQAGTLNNSGVTYVSWTFREQPKFFDVVTYTGDGSGFYREIPHSLNSQPGFVIIKRTDSTSNWWVTSRYSNGTYAIGNGTTDFALNSTNAASAVADATGPGGVFGSGTFKPAFIAQSTAANASGATYVAYLFAHNAGGFGLSGTDNVISCGSFTNDSGGYSPFIDLGYEPQWILTKRTDSSTAGEWKIMDNMRGMPAYRTQALLGVNPALFPNSSNAETDSGYAQITPTGFYSGGTANATYIYIAIRRGPMKVPTSGTSVFVPATFSTASGASQLISSPTAIDMGLLVHAPVNGVHYVATRLIGNTATLQTQSTSAESTTSTDVPTPTNQNAFTNSMSFRIEGSNQTYWNSTATGTNCFYGFRRAPGFFDVVCYTGDNQNPTRSIPHNLAAVPELIIHKYRNVSGVNWNVYLQSLGTNAGLILNGSNATITPRNLFGTPSASNFVVKQTSGDTSGMNWTGTTYVAYLFATCAGVSKVGSYTGTGALQTIDCGFTGGARFVLIKRTDSTGDWYVYDSARGISSGNDPYLFLNSTAAEVTGTNYVDTTSVGFQVTAAAPAGLNASGGTYIFLAIA